MTIRDRGYPSGDATADRLRRKANQEWDMAGLARQDGDLKDAERHTNLARDYERQLREYLGC